MHLTDGMTLRLGGAAGTAAAAVTEVATETTAEITPTDKAVASVENWCSLQRANATTLRKDDDEDDDEDGNDDAPVPPHPLGIKPLGNKFLARGPDAKDAAGTFQTLPDELLLHLLEYLDETTLVALGSTCRFLYAFSVFDELWKSLALASEGWQPSAWLGTWRASYRAHTPKKKHARMGASAPAAAPTPVTVDCGHVFSDVLHRPFVCSHVDPARFARGIPAANQIRRLTDLTADAFAAAWTNTPFILTANADVRAWPARRTWTLDALRARYAATAFRAEAVDWPYALYDAYRRATTDESPLYLFDRQFAEKMGVRVGTGPPQAAVRNDDIACARATSLSPEAAPAYWPPACFGPDLFAVLGADRPAHRWLIAGPARSGSTFHKDPNGTSAWNAVLEGAKYWILFPPHAAVPGVFASADQSEVTSPLSIAEWLLAFHAEARRQQRQPTGNGGGGGCIEGVCRAGEVLHVPSGWWHLVVNLEPGVALTQNFVPPAHLAAVLRFLRDRPEQVTGFAPRNDAAGAAAVLDPYRLFVERLRPAYPNELQDALATVARHDDRRKRTWEAVVRGEPPAAADGCETAGWMDRTTTTMTNGDDEKRQKTGGNSSGSGFTFGFGGDDDDDLEIEIP